MERVANTVGPAALALRRELVRKSVHVTSVVAPLAYAAGMPRSWVLAVLAALLGVAVAVEVARRYAPPVRRSFQRVASPILRPHEEYGWSGATWLLVAFTGVVALAPREPAIVAMLAVSVGDAAAAIVGRSLAAWREARSRDPRVGDGDRQAGESRLHSPVAAGGKTLAGSMACLAVTTGGAFWLGGLPLIVAGTAGLVAAMAERPRGPLDDNVRVAASVAATVMLMNALLSVG